MKKILFALCACLVAAGLSLSAKAETVLRVGASPTPHAELLQEAQKLLKPQGITLEIVDYSDYVLPNVALDNKELDANFFQHKPYLDDFNKEKGTKLTSLGTVHYEPFGIYAGKCKDLAKLKDGAVIGVPNDTTNEARALLLLQDMGLITLKEGAGLTATRLDIVKNPRKVKIEEIEAAQLGRSLPDLDLAVINGNYAILAGLKVKDALRAEAQDLCARLEALEVVIAMHVGDNDKLYGSVTSSIIGDALAAQGVEVDRRRILMDAPIRTLGDHPVRIRLHADVIAVVPVKVVSDHQPEPEEAAPAEEAAEAQADAE